VIVYPQYTEIQCTGQLISQRTTTEVYTNHKDTSCTQYWITWSVKGVLTKSHKVITTTNIHSVRKLVAIYSKIRKTLFLFILLT